MIRTKVVVALMQDGEEIDRTEWIADDEDGTLAGAFNYACHNEHMQQSGETA